MSDVPGIETVRADGRNYFVLYMRYTVLYWFLAVCAAGTAISTAVKTAYDAHAPSVSKTDTSNRTDVKAVALPHEFDGWIVGLAVATVIATTLQSTIHPDQMAERFRFGQLLIEKALTRYDGRLGVKTQADVDAVMDAYNHAQDMLQGGITQLAQKVTDTLNRSQ